LSGQLRQAGESKEWRIAESSGSTCAGHKQARK
jgi:hypothetical protein